MKHFLCFLLIPGLTLSILLAQVPQGISYQAVARDNTGALLTNQNLDVRFTIHETSATGTVVFEEIHTLTTNAYGLFTAVIGEGTVVSGTFSSIGWGDAAHFLEVGIDPGSGFVNMGTTRFVSVPYSQFSDKSNMAAGDLTDVSASSPNSGEVLKWNGTEWAPAADAGGATYTGGTGISISGSVIDNTAPDQPVSLTGTGATTVTGTYPNFTVSSTDDNTTYTGGAGISIIGTSIDNTAPDQIVSLSGSGATTVSGSYPNFTVSSTDNNTTYTAGTGIGISGTTINNTGDVNATDDITVTSNAGGDVSGNFSGLTVTGIQGRPATGTAPVTNQVLKWNGAAWAPATDNAGSSVWGTSSGAIYYNGGDVGIGTTNPDARQEIYHNSSLSDPHILLHENGNDYARLNFDNNNGSNYWTIAAYIASNNQNDRLNFWNGTSGDVMTITGDGEVGIGVGISPKVPFHIGNGRRVLFGTDTLGNGDKLMFLPDKHAFRVGTLDAGASSTYWNRDSIGEYSFASGRNTRAQGEGATAMGRDTEATNSYAFASGFFTNADGLYSTAMGFNTDAFALGSTALGYSTDAEQNYSFAAGYFAEAQAIYSIAIGNAVRAQSFASMAVGRYNVGGGSATSWISSDPIFEIGIGTGPSSRANAMTVRKNGNVGIGTTTPGARLHVNGGELRIGTLEELSDGGSYLMQVNSVFAPETNASRSLGNSTYRWTTVYATNGTISTSDLREKKNVKDIRYGLKEIMKLRPVSYKWINQPEHGPKLGLIAQDVQQVIEEVVLDKDWEYDEETGEKREVEAERLGIYYSDLIPVLIKGMQEQQEIIEQQQKDIEELKDEVKRLKN